MDAGQCRRAAVYLVTSDAANVKRKAEGAVVRSILAAGIGGILGFGAALLAIGAVVLLATGVGGGILVRERPGTGRVLNYDPSDVVLRGIAMGAAALFVLLVFVAVFFLLRRQEKRRGRRFGQVVDRDA